MSKNIETVSMRKMTQAQTDEAKQLGLSGMEWRWYDAIRRAGPDGAAWGPLPAHASRNLLRLGLIVSGPAMFTVVAKEFAS